MDAILIPLALVKDENRRNKVFTMIKQLKMREYSAVIAHTGFSLNSYILVILNSTVPSSLTSCIQNVVDIFRDAVDVTS